MRVQFLTNLGSRDAAALELDHTECTIDAVVDVPEKAGEELIQRGYARSESTIKAKAKVDAPKAPEVPPADKK